MSEGRIMNMISIAKRLVPLVIAITFLAISGIASEDGQGLPSKYLAEMRLSAEDAQSLSMQTFLMDYGLDSDTEISTMDMSIYLSKYTTKSWWIFKLTDGEIGETYLVSTDDGIVSKGWGEVERYEQNQMDKAGKISPLLSAEIARTSEETLTVIIVLKDQPNIREIVTSAEEKYAKELVESLEHLDADKLDEVKSDIRKEVLNQSERFNLLHGQRGVLDVLVDLDAEIIFVDKIRNQIVAKVLVTDLDTIASSPEVQIIEPDLTSALHLDISSIAINANYVWPSVQGNTYTGVIGLTNEVSIFDTGIDCSHPDLTCYGSWNYVSSYEATTDDLHGHGTHVAGIVASQNSIYKGVAPGVRPLNEKVCHSNGCPWSSIIQALSHSYSYLSEIVQNSNGYYPGPTLYNSEVTGDSSLSKTFDAYVEAGLISVISAGNDGPNYNTINIPGDAFNVITVANFDDKNTISRDDDEVYSGPQGSSRGDTGDGRTKPDVAAPGENIWSTNNLWETQNDFQLMSGTSMAAPHVSGIAALMIDQWAKLYRERLAGTGFVYGGPLAIRAIIYNSADETKGEYSTALFDRISGTGYVDAYLAMAQADKNRVEILSLSNGQSKYYPIEVNPGDQIKATIVWNRHVDINTLTPKSLSDIDIHLYDSSGSLLVSSSSVKNNWEKISYTYTGTSPTILKVRVYGWNVPTAVGTETIALAMTQPSIGNLYFPDFTDTNDPNSWRSWLVLQNPTTSTANLGIEMRSRSGALLYSGSDTIAPKSVKMIKPRNYVGYDFAGSAIITSDQPIVGTCEINRNNNQMCMSYKAPTQKGTKLYYPDFTDTNDPNSWRSWLVLQNPTTSTASIGIEIRSRSGALLYSGSDTIGPKAVKMIKPRNYVGYDFAGSAIITSNQPIVGTCEINRNNNLMCMAYAAIIRDA